VSTPTARSDRPARGAGRRPARGPQPLTSEPAFDATWLEARLYALSPDPPEAWCVAWSGGADSTALLAALVALRDRPPHSGPPLAPLRAVHIDHHLQPASAGFRHHCRKLARHLAVPLVVRNVQVDQRRGRSPEGAAREARYAALASALRPGEALLTAQHAEDQLETVLLQLLRGGGVAGLAAMPDCVPFGRGLLLRPLLPVPGAALRAYLSQHGLTAIEDPSNADTRFDRNYLRRELLPGLLSRWPAAARTVARSARHAAAADAILRREGARDAAAAADGSELDMAVLRRLSPQRQRHALRSWIAGRGLALPDERSLAQVQRLLEVRGDAQPRVHWAGVEVRRHAGRLYLGTESTTRGLPAGLSVAQSWDWHRSARLALPDGGSLALQRDLWGDVDLARLPGRLDVRLRHDAAAQPGARRDCDVKSLLREAGVPAWRRAQVPLVHADGRLVAVADLWCAESLRPRTADAQRARFVWQQG
jgi:tRNA(Ile)-lysidine synthase